VTYKSDVLSALSGIYRVFEQGVHPVQTLQGLPVVISSRDREDQNTFKIITALCWDHYIPKKARAEWTSPHGLGLVGQARCYGVYVDDMLDFVEVAKVVRLEYADGHTCTLKELTQSQNVLYPERVDGRIALPRATSENNKTSTRRDLFTPTVLHLYAPVSPRINTCFRIARLGWADTLWA
jgi:hypothetical protein